MPSRLIAPEPTLAKKALLKVLGAQKNVSCITLEVNHHHHTSLKANVVVLDVCGRTEREGKAKASIAGMGTVETTRAVAKKAGVL
jgi:hypothetical protein